jgi:hypothetical protein
MKDREAFLKLFPEFSADDLDLAKEYLRDDFCLMKPGPIGRAVNGRIEPDDLAHLRLMWVVGRLAQIFEAAPPAEAGGAVAVASGWSAPEPEPGNGTSEASPVSTLPWPTPDPHTSAGNQQYRAATVVAVKKTDPPGRPLVEVFGTMEDAPKVPELPPEIVGLLGFGWTPEQGEGLTRLAEAAGMHGGYTPWQEREIREGLPERQKTIAYRRQLQRALCATVAYPFALRELRRAATVDEVWRTGLYRAAFADKVGGHRTGTTKTTSPSPKSAALRIPQRLIALITHEEGKAATEEKYPPSVPEGFDQGQISRAELGLTILGQGTRECLHRALIRIVTAKAWKLGRPRWEISAALFSPHALIAEEIAKYRVAELHLLAQGWALAGGPSLAQSAIVKGARRTPLTPTEHFHQTIGLLESNPQKPWLESLPF